MAVENELWGKYLGSGEVKDKGFTYHGDLWAVEVGISEREGSAEILRHMGRRFLLSQSSNPFFVLKLRQFGVQPAEKQRDISAIISQF